MRQLLLASCNTLAITWGRRHDQELLAAFADRLEPVLSADACCGWLGQANAGPLSPTPLAADAEAAMRSVLEQKG